MHSSARTLWNRTLLCTLLGFVSSFTSTSAQQQPQPPPLPPPMCKTATNPSDEVDVGSKDTLEAAVKDRNCRVIRILNGTYSVNLEISGRTDLTIKSAERHRVTIKGPAKDRQTIYIVNSSKITIQDLVISSDQGNIGVFVSERSGRAGDIELKGNIIKGYSEAGVKITSDSKVKLLNNQIVDNKINNGVGVIIEASEVELSENEIRDNGEGIQALEGASVALSDSKISQNTGCGVRVTGGTVKDGKGRSNWIFGNRGGNTCPWELSRTIRKPEILVPSQFTTLQEAIEDAEPVRGAEDIPYTVRIQSGKDEYVEQGLCLDRSVKIQGDHKARIRPADPQKPTILIGSKDCPLHREEKGNVDSEAGDAVSSIRIHITGGLTVGPPDGAQKGQVGVQIETLHQDSAHKTFLKVTLKDITVENAQAGIEIRPTDTNHKLAVQISGTTPLRDTDCSDPTYPDFLRGNIDPISTLASIQKNKVGIWLDNSKQADLTVALTDVEIGRNETGIRFEGGGKSKFSIERSRVIKNEGQGIVAQSKGTNPQAIDELNASLVRIWQNKGGGVQLELDPDARSRLKAHLINVDARKNTRFAVYIQGNVEVLLKAIGDIPITQAEHECGINDNFGPGVRAHGSAILTIENMFVSGNGYEDEEKTKPVRRTSEPGASKVGPDGIFASDSVQLTVQNTYVGPNNAGVGIALQASQPHDAAKTALKDNYIASNRKWGVSYILRDCLAERTMPDKFNGKVEGQNNVLVGNGFRLSKVEESGGPDLGLGRGQVCPKDLEFLILRVQ